MTKKKLHFKEVLLGLCMALFYIPASGQSLVWAKSVGSDTTDMGTSVTTDASGNVYTLGTFQNTADFDPGAGTSDLVANGTSNFFISKLDTSGNLVWAKGISGVVSFNIGKSMAVDTSGNVYITGSFSGTVDFDPGSSSAELTASSYDIFILKLDSSGNFVWVKRVGGAGAGGLSYSLALDISGDIYTTGLFFGTLDFDPGPSGADLTAAGGADIFILKLDASGNFVWARNMGGAGASMSGNAIALDGTGNVYTTGGFFGTVDFDPGPDTFNLVSNSYPEMFISKLDATGNFVWAKKIGANTPLANNPRAEGKSISIDAAGNVYTSGSFSDTVDFDPGDNIFNLGAAGNTTGSSFISKLDAAGNFIWAKSINAGGFSGIYSTVNNAGEVYATGSFTNMVDFDPDPNTVYNLQANGNQALYVLKLNTMGDFVWARRIATDIPFSPAAGQSIATDTSGHVHVTGYFQNTVDFDPGPDTHDLIANGDKDIFILKMNGDCKTYSNLFISGCDSFTLNGQTYNTTGTYTQTYPNTAGCDSIITLKLTINFMPDTFVTQTGNTLTATDATGVSYQWINCDQDNITVPGQGATQRNFTPTANGTYAVVVTGSGGCRDTSGCYTINGIVGIEQIDKNDITNVYPNPASGFITITSSRYLHHATLILTNLIGQRIVEQTPLNGKSHSLDISGYAPGIYMIEIREGNKVSRVKVVKD